jgi:hypothetical protein
MVINLAFVAVLGATAALVQPNPQTPAPKGNEVTAQTQAAEKKICKKLPSTGTRMAKRACLTQKEWEELERDSDS